MPRHSEATLAAIKNAVDIVALVGEYLPLHRSGSKFKALCPFHDDHNPSLELNPERQSFKCWSCGAGGDVFDFVKDYERVEFPEALRMLADRAGVALENPSAGRVAAGPVEDRAAGGQRLGRGGVRRRRWAESPEALAYVEERGLDAGERRAVPARLRPRGARLADAAGAEARVIRSTCWSRPAWSSAPAEAPGRSASGSGAG